MRSVVYFRFRLGNPTLGTYYIIRFSFAFFELICFFYTFRRPGSIRPTTILYCYVSQYKSLRIIILKIKKTVRPFGLYAFNLRLNHSYLHFSFYYFNPNKSFLSFFFFALYISIKRVFAYSFRLKNLRFVFFYFPGKLSRLQRILFQGKSTKRTPIG